MANRKVFLSMLGTGFYGETIYVNNENSFESSPTRYIQQATLQCIGAENWTENDAMIIALTESAKEKNWIVAGNKRKKMQTTQEEEYTGLKDILTLLNLPIQTIELPIPDGKHEDEMWQIFTSIYEKLEQGDELYIDLTHSFRYLPMLLLVLVDYARFLKNVVVKSMTYGNWEARNLATNKAPIVNLMPIIALQNWTSAASEFVKNGNADAILQATNEGLRDLLRAGNRDKQIIELNKASKNLNNWVNQIRTCRGKGIMSSQEFNILQTRLNNSDKNILKPLTPILNRITQSFNDNGFIEGNSGIANAYAAAKWCVEMKLWQSAITILEEAIITLVCDKVGLTHDSIPNRELVSSALHIKSNDIPQEKWKIKDGEEENLKIVLSTDLFENKEFLKEYQKIKDLRNDFNHSGMRQTCKSAQSVINSIKDLVEKSSYLFQL